MSKPAEMLPSEVLIRELGPREGFQIHSAVIPTEKKLELIAKLVAAGLRSIEVTSFVRPDRVPQLADAEQVVAGLPATAGATEFTALYLNQKGFQRAEATGSLRNLCWLYTAASNSFLQANSNVSIDAALAAVPEWLRTFNAAGKALHGLVISTALGCEIEGEIRPARVIELVERYLAACEAEGSHISEVCLADTVGRGTPATVREAVRGVRALGPNVSLHLHDTRGLGMVNVYAGLLEGVSIFETSVGGLGGCPFTPGAAGNVPTEEVVSLCEGLGIKTGVDVLKCCAAARTAEKMLGSALPGKLYKVVNS
jgi:hydroxymethylglutaryl-CoA lyase